ncbi:MAG: hypothetical protein ACI9ON_002019 [Limisphaerales bacterium]|jgi:uncharacterized protein YheU (UPF0270 family)
MIRIPSDQLSEVALEGIVDAFILREGTDYGHQDIDIETKRLRVRRQLDAEVAAIFYYPESDYIDLRLLDDSGEPKD